jgi:hypothetical protein
MMKAGTSIVLLADGSPVCRNCSSCSVCHQLILDEAITTGDVSYHKHCLKCKICLCVIEERLFAKSSSGVYCMICHNWRVMKARRQGKIRKLWKEGEANTDDGGNDTPTASLNPFVTSADPTESHDVSLTPHEGLREVNL